MKDSESLHQKIQGLCDCFATNDPLKEMSEVKNDPDTDEAALKWIALAILHGINSNASEIKISNNSSDGVKVTAEYRTADLPSPGSQIGDKIINAVRELSHLEGKKDKTTLAIGIRDNSMDLKIKSKHKDGNDKISIQFP